MAPLLNGPIQPPIQQSTVPYSTVVHETRIMEQYSLVQPYSENDHLMKNMPDLVIMYMLVLDFMTVLNIFILILQHLFHSCILYYLLMVT